MHLIRRIIIGLGVTIAAACLVAIILFNWSVTGWKALTVPTGSMRPNINPGSLVLVRSVPNSSLHIGDVITYANPLEKDSTISHRIIKTYLLGGKIPAFITKGDANPSADQPIVGGLVKGKVMFSIPYVGTALSWTHTLIGILIIIYIPALFIMFEEVKRLVTYYRQMMPYKTALILKRERENAKGISKFGVATVMSLLILAGSIAFAFPVYALLKSNTVTLGPNNLKVAPITPPHTCSTNTTNNNTVIISNTTTQTATTGNANNSNNTTGGSATSGNATNNNSTSVNVTITNC